MNGYLGSPPGKGVGCLAVAIATAALAVVVGWLRWGESWSDRSIERTKRSGEAVIDALDRYQEDHDVYPKSLQELVPRYLGVIPRPAAGVREWRYGPFQGRSDQFLLVVDSRWKGVMFYDGPQWMSFDSLERSWFIFQEESF